MKERIRLLCRTLRQGSSAVTAIVTGCRGATPRSPGALLVLTAETALGTVGGGQAEHDIIGPAMEMLRGGVPVQQGWHQCLSTQELRHMGQEFGGEEEILLLRCGPKRRLLPADRVRRKRLAGGAFAGGGNGRCRGQLYREAAGGRPMLCVRGRACQPGAGPAS